jgi:hypothetical protein
MTDGPFAATKLVGPLPDCFAISTFPAPATTSTRPTRRELTWDQLVRLLTTHTERADKDGPGWSGATYKPGTTRAIANVEAWSLAVGDFDHCTRADREALETGLDRLGLAYVIYSTYRNTPEDVRFRVVLPLVKPVPAQQWPDTWQRINHHLFLEQNDPQTKDVSRMFYHPACPPGAPHFAASHEGGALVWDGLPPAPRAAAQPSTSGAANRGTIPHLGRRALQFVARGAPVGQQRGEALAAGRNYLASRHSPEDTVEAVWRGLQASPCGDPANPWTREHVVQLVQDLARREPSPPRTAPAVGMRTAAITAPKPGNGRIQSKEVASATGAPAEQGAAELPWIDATNENLREITPQAWEALVLANDPPRLFQHGGVLVRLEADDDGAPILRVLTLDRTTHELARAANFFVKRTRQDGEGNAEVTREIVLPPSPVVHDVLAVRTPPLPVLTRIVETPIFAPDGTLQTAPGYHLANRRYLALPPTLTLPPVSERPTAADLERARTLLLEELLGDFPFVGAADRAHALALLLLPFVRDWITGPTPGHMIEAPAPGSGKDLLADVLTLPAVGRNIGVIAEARDDEEWRKRITSQLREGHAVIHIGNLRRSLDTGVLAAALTATQWTDRLLGKNETVRVPVRCAWVVTANNPILSTEMARRFVRVRLDPRVDRPWEREDFRYEDLRSWAGDHRGELIWAALTLVRGWQAAGAPAFSGRPLGSYESWSRILGGILTTAGIPGFLGNAREFYETADLEGTVWRQFVAAWWETHGSDEVSAGDLFALAVETEGLDLGKGNDRSQRITFGKKLTQLRDRVIGDHRIVAGDKKQRAQRWRLVPTGSAADSPSADEPHAPSQEVNVVNVGECFHSLPRAYARAREASVDPASGKIHEHSPHSLRETAEPSAEEDEDGAVLGLPPLRLDRGERPPAWLGGAMAMIPTEVVAQARRRGAVLLVDGRRLGYRAPVGVVDAVLYHALATHQIAVLNILTSGLLPCPQCGRPLDRFECCWTCRGRLCQVCGRWMPQHPYAVHCQPCQQARFARLDALRGATPAEQLPNPHLHPCPTCSDQGRMKLIPRPWPACATCDPTWRKRSRGTPTEPQDRASDADPPSSVARVADVPAAVADHALRVLVECFGDSGADVEAWATVCCQASPPMALSDFYRARQHLLDTAQIVRDGPAHYRPTAAAYSTPAPVKPEGRTTELRRLIATDAITGASGPQGHRRAARRASQFETKQEKE